MLLIGCGLYLALTIMVGYGLVATVMGARRRHWAELAGLSFAGGIGFLPLILFIFSLAGKPPSRFILILIGAIAIAYIATLWWRNRLLHPIFPARGANRWNAWILIQTVAGIVIFAAVINVAITSLTPGLADIDAFGNWMFKAKFLLDHPLMPMPAMLLDPSLSYTHQDYPLSMPLWVTGMYASIGQIVEQAGKLYLLPTYLSLIGITYGGFRRSMHPAVALAITAVFVAAPIVTQHAGMAVAELPLLLFLMTSLSLLLQWMENGQRSNLIVSAIFAAFAAFTKNEGLALLPLIGFTTLIFTASSRDRNRWKDFAVSSSVALLLVLPWLIYRTKLPRTHEDYGGKLTRLSTLVHAAPRLQQVVPAFCEQFINVHNAGLLWVLLALSAIVGWRAFRRLPVLALWGLLLAHLGLYVFTFMVTPWDLNLLLPMISPKLLMHASATAALLIALHCSSLKPKPD